jgi:diguanylate cyclase (GGDEF)-like protein
MPDRPRDTASMLSREPDVNDTTDRIADAWRSARNLPLFMTQAEAALDYAFQPIVDIHSGEVFGYEALLREFGRLGFETPREVFDYAAKHDRIGELETLLRRKAIAKFARMGVSEKAKLFLNVDARNLSTMQDQLDATLAATRAHGLAPWNICLEIPEIHERFAQDELHRFVTSARDRGFGIALDDFGQGYSQLRLLYQYEPGILKIDRFFITSLQNDARKRLFVSSVVDLAHVLGIRVVAEGVETASELRACRDVGCDLVQGYLVARPFTDITQARPAYPVQGDRPERPDMRKHADLDFLEQEMARLPSISENGSVAQALEIFQDNPLQTILPVVDAAGEPRGLIREADVKSFLYLSFGRDLLLNPTIDNHLHRFVRPCAVADINAPLTRLVDVSSDETADGIVITRAGRYVGCLLARSLLKISNEVRLQIAQDQNPLTKLPGNSAISDHVARSSAGADRDRAFCYIDFDSFKPFNDTYGFRIGDRALVLFSDLLKSKLGTGSAFVGHIGGDDFFVGLEDWPQERVARHMRDLRADFAHQVESLYSAEHRRQGFIRAEDRSGRIQTYPLLSCSIAVMHIPKGVVVDNLDMLSNHIARLKQHAKADPEGIAIARFGAPAPARGGALPPESLRSSA